MADLLPYGSNQNDPLIDYLQGSRKALMDLILNPPQIYKVSFWSGLPKKWAFPFLQDGQVKPLSVLEWASQAQAAVRWEYGTTVRKGSAMQGKEEWPDLPSMTSRWTAIQSSLTEDTYSAWLILCFASL